MRSWHLPSSRKKGYAGNKVVPLYDEDSQPMVRHSIFIARLTVTLTTLWSQFIGIALDRMKAKNFADSVVLKVPGCIAATNYIAAVQRHLKSNLVSAGLSSAGRV